MSNFDAWYLDHLATPWQIFYSNDVLQGVEDPEQQKLFLGGEVCMWGETVDPSDLQQTVWPRAAAAAGTCLSSSSFNFLSLFSRFFLSFLLLSLLFSLFFLFSSLFFSRFRFCPFSSFFCLFVLALCSGTPLSHRLDAQGVIADLGHFSTSSKDYSERIK
jgi:hypothetical protein